MKECLGRPKHGPHRGQFCKGLEHDLGVANTTCTALWREARLNRFREAPETLRTTETATAVSNVNKVTSPLLADGL